MIYAIYSILSPIGGEWALYWTIESRGKGVDGKNWRWAKDLGRQMLGKIDGPQLGSGPYPPVEGPTQGATDMCNNNRHASPSMAFLLLVF